MSLYSVVGKAVDPDFGFQDIGDGRRRRSLYVRMRDGVRIAISIWLPADASKPCPSVVHFTRYWREKAYNGPGPVAIHPGDERKPLADWGYAYIAVDARGTGASFGVRSLELPEEEVLDGQEILAWIARQLWSNGSVATMGISYGANTALMAATLPSPALKAVIARFVDIDSYEDLIAPGGLPNAMFISQWGDYVRKLDEGDPSVFGPLKSGVRITGVAPVDEDANGALLNAALAEHSGNFYVPDYIRNAEVQPLFKDSVLNGNGGDERPSIARRFQDLERNAVPTFIWASWMDAGTAAGALRFFSESTAPGEIIIGAWSHGAGQNGNPHEDPYQDPNPPHDRQLMLFRAFLDRYLWSDPQQSPPRRITYRTLNEDNWRQTEVWPPAASEAWTVNLSAAGELTTAAPSAGVDLYEIDFAAGSGDETRWTTQLNGGPVAYGDRRDTTATLLHYQTNPFDEDVVFVGAPLVSLLLSSDVEDLAVVAYLDDVAPDGRVTYVTEGQLRLLHRPVEGAVDGATLGPRRTFKASDARPLAPGCPERFEFPLLPVALRIARGHRLQLSLAGADSSTFIRVPATGAASFSIHLDPTEPSTLTLRTLAATPGARDPFALLGVVDPESGT